MSFVLVRWFLGLFFILGQFTNLDSRSTTQESTPGPVVQAVLFWMQGCPNCEVVLNQFLPEVKSRYGSKLEFHLVEVRSTEDVGDLYRVGKAYGLQQEQIGVPLLIIGSHVLIGSDQIPEQLTGLIDQYLANGGVAYPDLENLTLKVVSQEVPLQETPQYSGMTLAAVIGAGLILALVFAFWMVIRAFGDIHVPEPATWINLAIPVLAVLGLGVALYMIYVEASSAQAICGPIGDCNAVQKSSYAKAFGVIPVGLIGVAGYLAILAAWLWGRMRSDRLAGYVPILIWGMAVFGTLYSVYLTYLELFVIKAVCIWCLSSAVIITLIMLASLPGCLHWLANTEEG